MTRLALLALLAALGLLALSPGRMSLPAIDRDESRYAQATRQMIETGDYLDVRYLDQPRYVQPAGAYWTQAAAVLLQGDTNRRLIWPHRIPSLLAGIAAICLTGWIGLRLYGWKAALIAGGLLAATFLLNFEARIATTDATLLACVLAAQAALLVVWQRRDAVPTPRLAPLLFWAALAVGVMVKGPVAFLVSFGTLAGLAVQERRLAWWRRLRPLVGVALLLAIVLPWVIAIEVRSDGAFLATALGHNLVGKLASGQESHGQPPGYYLLLWSLTFWPVTLLMAQAAPRVWSARAEPATQFLLAWAIPAWLVLEVAATKLPHYVLPLYPALALLVAAPLAPLTLSSRPGRIAAGVVRAGWIAVTLVLCLGPTLALAYVARRFDPLALAAAFAGLALGAVAWWATRRDARALAALAVVALGLVTVGAAYGRVLPRLAPLWISQRAVAQVAVVRPCDTSTVYAAGYAEPSLAFLLGRSVRLSDPITTGTALAADPACALALVESRQDAPFRAALARAGGAAPREVGRVDGFDYSNGHAVSLGVYAARVGQP